MRCLSQQGGDRLAEADPRHPVLHLEGAAQLEPVDDALVQVVGEAASGREAIDLVRNTIEGAVADERRKLAQIEQAQVRARALGSRRFEANGEYIRALLMLRSGDRASAQRHLHLALELCGETGIHFVGGQVYGALARVAGSSDERHAMLAKGEALLSGGALSHNFFGFCDGAIDSSLEHGEWDQVLRYADMLERFTAAEPFPWSDFALARARLCGSVGTRSTTPNSGRSCLRAERS